jgi:integral membrane protein (TIGR01906 family)
MKYLEAVGKFLWILAVPVVIMMTAIRVLISPAILPLQYNSPGFPSDIYGFTLQDRLNYAKISIDYLNNGEDLTFFNRSPLPDGSPMYNERELSHMLDVKVLIQKMDVAWVVIIAILALTGLLAWRKAGLKAYFGSLSKGGWLTLIIIALILVGVGVGFNWLFTTFHQLFFTGDTWLFLYSDTLIRLFPIPFWENIFIAMGVISILLGLLFAVGGKRIARRLK